MTVVSGCTGMEPALIGAAASGLQTGVSATKWGKVNVVFHASEQRVHEATTTALEHLALTTRDVYMVDNGKATRYVIVNDDGDRYRLTVRAKTAQMTAVQFDVGWFGSSPAAHLIIKRIRVLLFGDDDEGFSG